MTRNFCLSKYGYDAKLSDDVTEAHLPMLLPDFEEMLSHVNRVTRPSSPAL